MTETKATEAAQRKAEEASVDLASIEGTGADGAITAGDVEQEIAKREAANQETFSAVVNPRLDAAEYVAPDGRRFGRDAGENDKLTSAEYDELNAEKVAGLQPIVKESS